MAFNISSFAARVNSTGLAKNNLFEARITSPLSLNLPIQGELPFLCRSASIPGLDLNTIDHKPQGWGNTEKRASEFTKSNLTLTFMVDSNFAVKQYFHRWMQTIINYNNLKGAQSEDSSGKLPYEFEYKANYSGVLDVIVYSENADAAGSVRSYTYKYEGAFPVAIGSIETAWENQAEIMLITVSFAYDFVSVAGMEETFVANRSTNPVIGRTATGGASSGLASATSFGLPIQSLTSGRLPTGIQDAINRVTAPLNNALSSINNIRSSVRSLTKLF